MVSTNITFSDEMCRVCLKDQAEKEIFEIHQPTTLEYATILNACVSIQVTKGDGLPRNICNKCLKLLITFHRFKINAIENDFKLKKALEEKLEKEREKNRTTVYTIENIQQVKILDESKQIVSEVIPLEGQTFQVVSAVIIDNNPPVVEQKIENIISTDDLRFVTDSDSSGPEIEETNVEENEDKINEDDELVANKFSCIVCGKKMSNKSNLKQHMFLHNKIKPYSCDICGKRFSKAEHVLIHTRIHTGDRPHKCLLCKRTFIQYATLKAHLRTHTGDKAHMCTVCGKSFRHSGTLINHNRIHTGETPFICSICGKGFNNAGNLSTHKRFHTKERPYTCTLCEKSFVTSSHLRVHEKSHTGEKPYVCIICQKGFVRSEHLKSHLVIHSGRKPFQCKLCPRKYTQSSHLRRHEKTAHVQKDKSTTNKETPEVV